MGKYTSLARKTEETETQKNRVPKGGNNTYKHSIAVDTGSNSITSLPEGSTNLRTTNLTNLTETNPSPCAVVRCIHGTTSHECAVCSGYVRWLMADEDRLRRAQGDPGTVRCEFWQLVRSGG